MEREAAKQRAESDAQAPPGEESESRIARYGALFDSSADAVLKEFEGQALQGRLQEGIAARRETLMKGLLEREAQQRLRRNLADTQGIGRELVRAGRAGSIRVRCGAPGTAG